MDSFQAMVPPGAAAGSSFDATAPGGSKVRAFVPPGVQPGMWTQVTPMQPHAVIASIRHDHMAGFDHADATRVRGLKDRLARSVERLSEDLYSSKTHCIMELVQNADDNSYAPGQVPTLQFAVHDTFLVVANNELGFQEQNVRAICDIARSTKAQKEGARSLYYTRAACCTRVR